MVQTEELPAALSTPRVVPRQGQRRAALSVRLSAVIVTATIDEPRVLTVHIGHDPVEHDPVEHDPVEALPSGPLEVEHRTLEVGLRASVRFRLRARPLPPAPGARQNRLPEDWR